MPKDYKRNVYILGAGFSKPANGPLMSEFFDAMMDTYHRGPLLNDDKSCFDFALEFRQEMAKTSDNLVLHLDNLEDLFGLLEMQVALGRRDEEHKRKFVHSVLRTLESRMWNAQTAPGKSGRVDSRAESKRTDLQNSWGIQNHRWLYYAFAEMVAQSHLDNPSSGDSIISFNYDLTPDRAFCELGYKVDYGLNSVKTTATYDSINRSPHSFSIPLYKLHGSANWFRCAVHQKTYVAPSRFPMGYSADSLLWDSAAKCPYCMPGVDSSKHTAFIVPPTWNKAIYQLDLLEVWRKAVEAISNADRIVVIGFSLPDTDIFFRYMLASGLKIGRGVKIYLLDPDERVARRYESFLSPTFRQSRFEWVNSFTAEFSIPFDRSWHRGTFDEFGIREISHRANRSL